MRKMWIAAVLLLPTLAWAEPKSAADWYSEGENQYNLGNFDKAVEAFKKGFELETVEGKKAVYLFNIAQSYRQANDCKNAHFFYKRFLAVADNDSTRPVSAKTRKQVQDRIAELEQCANQAASISKKPPVSIDADKSADDGAPHGEAKPVTAAVEPATGGDVAEHAEAEKPASDGRPHTIVLRLTGGGTKVSTPGVEVPVQATFALTAGYPIAINNKLTIEAGAAATLSAVPFSYGPQNAQKDATGYLTAVMANGAATYELIPKLSARLDVGVGALLFSGIDVLDGPFTPPGTQADGTLTMFHVRGALSGEYAVTPNFVVILPSLAYSYSPPKDGLIKSITRITAFDFMAGISYRM
ncbi:MAG TPA: tetratricopeptide repeat protein [Kofleriaceae bacterium]|nr:tetratricopeptide repeat protein [Kofleriaceae bacterium]